MPRLIPKSRADIADRLADITGLATGLAGLTYAAGVAQSVTAGDVAVWFDAAQIVGGVLILIGFLPLFFILKSRGGRGIGHGWKRDGFTATLFQRAGITAFMATIIAMILLSTLENLILSRITTEALVDGLIAFGLISFSVSYFIYGRTVAE